MTDLDEEIERLTTALATDPVSRAAFTHQGR